MLRVDIIYLILSFYLMYAETNHFEEHESRLTTFSENRKIIFSKELDYWSCSIVRVKATRKTGMILNHSEIDFLKF